MDLLLNESSTVFDIHCVEFCVKSINKFALSYIIIHWADYRKYRFQTVTFVCTYIILTNNNVLK